MLDCTGCAKVALVTIRMRVAGREIVFRRCSKCESNMWQDGAGDLSASILMHIGFNLITTLAAI